jgi:hypothetical protein
MHRTAQVVQLQIEEGVDSMEDPEPADLPPAPSPFETPIPAAPIAKPWRHNKKRRWSKS